MGAFHGGMHEAFIGDMRYRGPEEFDMRSREIERDDLGNPVGGPRFEDLFKPQIPDYKQYTPPSPDQPPQTDPVDPQQTQGGDHKERRDLLQPGGHCARRGHAAPGQQEQG